MVVALEPGGRLASLRFGDDATHCVILKGAPDRVLQHLGGVLAASDDGGSWHLAVSGNPLSAAEKSLLEGQNRRLAEEALRGLLSASCSLQLIAEFG